MILSMEAIGRRVPPGLIPGDTPAGIPNSSTGATASRQETISARKMRSTSVDCAESGRRIPPELPIGGYAHGDSASSAGAAASRQDRISARGSSSTSMECVESGRRVSLGLLPGDTPAGIPISSTGAAAFRQNRISVRAARSTSMDCSGGLLDPGVLRCVAGPWPPTGAKDGRRGDELGLEHAVPEAMGVAIFPVVMPAQAGIQTFSPNRTPARRGDDLSVSHDVRTHP
jgi:hypothetical protein